MSGRHASPSERIRLPGVGLIAALAGIGLAGPALVFMAETARGLPSAEPLVLGSGEWDRGYDGLNAER